MSRGGKRPGAGRPPSETGVARTESLHLRVTASQKAGWVDAARLEGESLSDVARKLLDEWAEKVLRA